MKILRRVIVAVLLAPFVLLLGLHVYGVYDLNNVCGPDRHMIGSEADAIEAAKNQTFEARYMPHDIPGYEDTKPGILDYSRTDNCCSAKRTRQLSGVIVWEVKLEGETYESKRRYGSAYMALSNCGVVFRSESFVSASPKR